MLIERVIPIFQNKNESKNYRRISISSQFSNIMEKLFEKMSNKYIEKFKLLSYNLCGLREGYSTAMALTDLVDNIATAIEKKLHTISIFLDFEKATDSIDYSSLLKKLGHYGIGGNANHCLSVILLEENSMWK